MHLSSLLSIIFQEFICSMVEKYPDWVAPILLAIRNRNECYASDDDDAE